MFFSLQHLVAMKPVAKANVSHMNQFQCLWVQLNASATNLALPIATAVLITLQNVVSENWIVLHPHIHNFYRLWISLQPQGHCSDLGQEM